MSGARCRGRPPFLQSAEGSTLAADSLGTTYMRNLSTTPHHGAQPGIVDQNSTVGGRNSTLNPTICSTTAAHNSLHRNRSLCRPFAVTVEMEEAKYGRFR